MGVGDILSSAGNVLGTIAKDTGRAVQEFAPEIGTALRGDAGEVAKEQREHQFQTDEQSRELQADQLERQLDAGRKYGTLTADQQQQLVQQITSIYPKAQDSGTLMTRLHRIARGPSVTPSSQGGPMAGETLGLPNNLAQAGPGAGAFPTEGTLQREAEAYRYSHPRLPTSAMANIAQLNSYAQTQTDPNTGQPYADYWSAPFDVQQAAHFAAFRARTKTSLLADPSSPTKFSYGTWNTDTGAFVGERIPAQPPPGYIATHSVTTDPFGVSTVTDKSPVVPGVTTPPVHPTLTPRGAAAQGTPPSTNGAPAPTGVAAALTTSPAAAPAQGAKRTATSAVAPSTGGGGSNMDRAVNREVFKAQVKGWAADIAKTQQEDNDVQTRLASMQQSVDEAKRGNGPAQVAIVASFLKSLVGGQGVRVTQAEWNQATQLRPWLAGIEAHFTPDGYVSFGQNPITPQQADQMLNEVKIKSAELHNAVERQLQQRPSIGGLIPKTSGAKAGTTSGPVSVTAPDGSVHQFSDQKSADKFKALAHIQ